MASLPTAQSGAPAAPAGEFVLDDGLDEDADEDMLAFQSTRTAAAEAAEDGSAGAAASAGRA